MKTKMFYNKRIQFLVVVLMGFLILCFFTPVVLVTAQGLEGQKELGEAIDGLLSQLDLQALQQYIDSLQYFSKESIIHRLKTYIQSERFDYTQFGQAFLSIFFQKAMDILPIFACVMAISLLSGILMTLKGSSGANTAIDTVFYICYAAALVPILGVLVECFTQTAKAITSMQQQMQLIFPLMLTLMAASGGALTVSICKPAVGFFSATIVSVIAQIVLPIAILIVAFSVAGNFTQELKIGKFTAFFKSINKWIMGICISVFGVFFTLQGLTAAHYDGIVRRAAKYAIGNGVPIIGGFLSGGFDLAIAGGILIKNSLGSLGIMLMLSVLFEPLLLLISVTLLLRFTSAIVQPFGDTRVSDFLSDTADNLHYCTAGLLLTAFLYFLCIVLMISASEALL